MLKIHSNDEGVLIETMQYFRAALEQVGIEGDAFITAQTNGDVTLIAALNRDTELQINLLNDDTEKRVKYCQK